MFKRSRSPLFVANAMLIAWWSTASAATTPAVSLGDVVVSSEASTAPRPALELSRVLRQALTDELRRAAGSAPPRQSLVLSANLTRLASERRDDRTLTSASLSLALRRANDDVLVAELRGRASVEDTSNNRASRERAAVEGAVHGALQRLPEVVARAR